MFSLAPFIVHVIYKVLTVWKEIWPCDQYTNLKFKFNVFFFFLFFFLFRKQNMLFCFKIKETYIQ